MERAPLSARHVLLAVRPGGRTCSPKVLLPFDGVPRASPVRGGSSLPPRFRSQVFSTSQRFPSRLELSGLVSCRNHPWAWPSPVRSFRAFPSQESRTPLGAACSLAVIPPRAEAALARPFTSRFPHSADGQRSDERTPTCLVPRAAMGSLSARPATPWFPLGRCEHAFRSPWARRAESPLSVGFTRFEASFLLRIRSRRTGSPRDRRPLLSWSSVPSEAFSAHTWESRTRPRGRSLPDAAVLPPRGGRAARGAEDLRSHGS